VIPFSQVLPHPRKKELYVSPLSLSHNNTHTHTTHTHMPYALLLSLITQIIFGDKVHIMKLLIIKFPPVPFFLLCRRPTQLLQQPILFMVQHIQSKTYALVNKLKFLVQLKKLKNTCTHNKIYDWEIHMCNVWQPHTKLKAYCIHSSHCIQSWG
jgi:hypothetical protein